MFGVCLEVGGKHAGSMVGAYGYIVGRFRSYDAPFVPMAALLFIGALLWLKVDASKEVEAEMVVTAAPAAAGL